MPLCTGHEPFSLLLSLPHHTTHLFAWQCQSAQGFAVLGWWFVPEPGPDCPGLVCGSPCPAQSSSQKTLSCVKLTKHIPTHGHRQNNRFHDIFTYNILWSYTSIILSSFIPAEQLKITAFYFIIISHSSLPPSLFPFLPSSLYSFLFPSFLSENTYKRKRVLFVFWAWLI